MPAGDLTDGNASAAESQRKALVHLNLHSTQLRFLNRLQIEARIRAELGTVNLPSRGISVDAKSPSRKLTVVSHGRVVGISDTWPPAADAASTSTRRRFFSSMWTGFGLWPACTVRL
jgi:hypothetical protein